MLYIHILVKNISFVKMVVTKKGLNKPLNGLSPCHKRR